MSDETQRVDLPKQPGDGYDFGGHGECRSCGAMIVWWVTPVNVHEDGTKSGGKRAPVDPDGTSHVAPCPQANDWRKR